MNINEVYKLVDCFEKSSLSKMGLEMEGVKLSLEKGDYAEMSGNPIAVQKVQTQLPDLPDKPEQTKKQDDAQGDLVIKAPLVGTFYNAASPEDAPFVEVGSVVKKGDVVGIIEAMKLMNEITAPADGIVAAIEVENEAMVEYDQVLIRIKES